MMGTVQESMVKGLTFVLVTMVPSCAKIMMMMVKC